MPDPDAVTLLANEVYAHMARWPFPEHGADLTFIFRLVGLRVGSEESRAVWERVLTRLHIEREYREKRGEGSPHMNGQPDARRDGLG
jgi:hypothetical protein